MLVRRGATIADWLCSGGNRLWVTEWSIPVHTRCLGVPLLLTLSEQLSGYGIQSLRGHLLHLAHIDPLECSAPFAVGSPVPSTLFMARLLATHGKGSERTAHAEEGGRLQPSIPGGGSDLQLIVLSVSLVGQRLACDESRSLVLIAHAHP